MKSLSEIHLRAINDNLFSWIHRTTLLGLISPGTFTSCGACTEIGRRRPWRFGFRTTVKSRRTFCCIACSSWTLARSLRRIQSFFFRMEEPKEHSSPVGTCGHDDFEQTLATASWFRAFGSPATRRPPGLCSSVMGPSMNSSTPNLQAVQQRKTRGPASQLHNLLALTERARDAQVCEKKCDRVRQPVLNRPHLRLSLVRARTFRSLITATHNGSTIPTHRLKHCDSTPKTDLSTVSSRCQACVSRILRFACQ